ncbi:MAG TPA: MFS transporter [Nostocaceae cyanobacterium]|nr:MFS transporter [Nostocaceae cyanobacterium]
MKIKSELGYLSSFLIIWFGQLISTIGSSMTSFAINIWIWEFTGQATSLTLMGFFSLLPSIAIALISGVIVDRYHRKLLMLVGDTVAVGTTIIILLLYWTNNLQIWHLYLTSSLTGIFSGLQSLAYSASVSLMVTEKHYTRASSLEFLANYGSKIIAPALSGYLYHIIGLIGIGFLDILTFSYAISSVILVHIPQPPKEKNPENQSPELANIWQELSYGWRYIKSQKSLLALLITGLLFWFFHDLGGSLYTPMILARSQNNTVLLGSLASAAGLGGVIGALIISTWGGTKQPIQGFFWGMMGAGLSKTVFGLTNHNLVWIGSQFCSSLNFPLNGSCENVIWLKQVPPQVQGRVFAARSLFLQLSSALAYLISGLLADQVFEPGMKANGSLAWLFGGIFGTNQGAGMALIYVVCALCMFLVGLFGYRFLSTSGDRL